jgi:hypothetical protein
MKSWATIYNFFAVLIILFMIMILHKDIRDNERESEALRLRYAVDYASAAGFRASLEGDNLGVSYQDLQNVKINPQNILPVFKNVLALNYDMASSDLNLQSLDKYISGMVLAVADGYYIATIQEVNTGTNSIPGNEYALKWGLKKPYSVQYDPNKYVAYNISSEQWVSAQQSGGSMVLDSGATYDELLQKQGVEQDKQGVLNSVNKRIMDDINYNIQKRSTYYPLSGDNDFIYLPSVQTNTGVNAVTKPSLLVTLQGVDFAGTQKLGAKSVGGVTLVKKNRVLGFTGYDGQKYYCYEGQMPISELGRVEKFFSTVDEAAQADFRPHMEYLKNSMTQ